MGKSKPNRNRLHKAAEFSPTGLVSIKDSQLNQQITDDKPVSLDTIAGNLKSTSADERVFGCTALGLLLSQPSMLKQIFDSQILRVVAPLVLDDKQSVRSAAASFLRCLSEEGGFESCDQMVRQDILTPVSKYMSNQSADWTTNPAGIQKDGRSSCFTDCVFVVLNLCECSAVAVRVSTEESIPSILLTSLSQPRHPHALLQAAAQCLYVMSEENEILSDLLKNDNSTNLLSKLISDTNTQSYTRVICAGILLNVYGDSVREMKVGESVLKILMEMLNTDSYTVLMHTLRNCFDVEETENTTPTPADADVDMEEGGDPAQEAKKSKQKHGIQADQLEENGQLLDGQKLCFEVITNMMAGDDWADIEDDDSSSDISAGTDVELEEDDMDIMESQAACGGFCKTLLDEGFHLNLLDRIQFLTSDIYECVASCDRTYKVHVQSALDKYSCMLTSALSCLSNVIPQLSSEILDSSISQEFLNRLISQTPVAAERKEDELVESLTTSIRSIVERLSTLQQSEVVLNDEQLNALHSLCQPSNTTTVINCLRTLSAVGTRLSKADTENPVVKTIGRILLDAVTSSQHIWIVLESIDALMDVFAEDSNNAHLKELNVLDTLQSVLPQIKAKVSKKDVDYSSYSPVLTTVRTNLPRFIKYKIRCCK